MLVRCFCSCLCVWPFFGGSIEWGIKIHYSMCCYISCSQTLIVYCTVWTTVYEIQFEIKREADLNSCKKPAFLHLCIFVILFLYILTSIVMLCLIDFVHCVLTFKSIACLGQSCLPGTVDLGSRICLDCYNNNTLFLYSAFLHTQRRFAKGKDKQNNNKK